MRSHHHCHCGLKEQLKKFKAGKLGLLGGVLIVGHLLFHVAECLIIPAIIVALSHHEVEATDELSDSHLEETTFTTDFPEVKDLHTNFFETLDYSKLLR